jgi:hypothetical protein
MPTRFAVVKKPPHRWFAPRFSLRMLMFIVTAAAIGAAVWWRWPVTVTKMVGKSPPIEETTTYHRGLWGNLIKHGVYRRTIDGRLEQESHYREGELGACEYRTGNLVLAYEFKNRRLVAAPNSPRGSPLMQRMADAHSNKSLDALWANVDLEYPETPLAEVLEDLRERFLLCLVMRSSRKDVYKAPITVNVKGWPMRIGFDAILIPQGLMLDYRYGTLCVVDVEGAADWRDATGVMELKPPSDTPLAERLDAPARVTWFVPLPLAIHNIGSDQGIPVELRVELSSHTDGETDPLTQWPGLPVQVMQHRSPNGRTSPPPQEPLRLTLREVLGLLLDQAHLHCREERGVLVIEPLPKSLAQDAGDSVNK